MRLVYSLVAISLAGTAFSKSLRAPHHLENVPAQHQQPLMPVLPKPDPDSKPAPDTTSGFVITDALSRDRSIILFANFIRDIRSLGERLEDSAQNATVLCPENAEIKSLPRKPWEDPEDYAKLGAQAYDGKDGEDRAHRNLRRFVEAHIVPLSPWKENEKTMALAGNSVWWETREGKKYIQPGSIEVVRVAEAVDNGEVWVIKGVVNYASK